MASLSGDCHRVSCTPGCQHLVNDVRSACKTVKCNETDLFTGVTKTRAFLQKIMPSISQLGPVDCDYAISEQHCQASCSMYNITAGAGVSFYELHNCIAVDPQSGQSSPEAVWKSCEGICKTKFEDLVGSCSTCGSLRFSNFMQDAGCVCLRAFDAFMRLVIVRRVGWPVIGHLVVMQPQAGTLWHRQRPILRKSARRHRHSMLPREHLFVQCQEWQYASELPSKRRVYGGGTDWCHPLRAQLHT
jgi:hypothetical protein